METNRLDMELKNAILFETGNIFLINIMSTYYHDINLPNYLFVRVNKTNKEQII